jgi:hypothetical protein
MVGLGGDLDFGGEGLGGEEGWDQEEEDAFHAGIVASGVGG